MLKSNDRVCQMIKIITSSWHNEDTCLYCWYLVLIMELRIDLYEQLNVMKIKLNYNSLCGWFSLITFKLFVILKFYESLRKSDSK